MAVALLNPHTSRENARQQVMPPGRAQLALDRGQSAEVPSPVPRHRVDIGRQGAVQQPQVRRRLARIGHHRRQFWHWLHVVHTVHQQHVVGRTEWGQSFGQTTHLAHKSIPILNRQARRIVIAVAQIAEEHRAAIW